MTFPIRRFFFLVALLFGCLLAGTSAQTLATGDGRGTISEPAFPTTTCKHISGTHTIKSNGQPASEETATSTTNIQNALNYCAVNGGGVVELIAGSGGYNAFIIKPIIIPSGVQLMIDAGVTVFGSLAPVDYDNGTGYCGTVNVTSKGGCYPLIATCGTFGTTGDGCTDNGRSNTTAIASSGISILGYGVIDGRGGMALLADSNENSPALITPPSWYTTTVAPYCQTFSWWCLMSYAYSFSPAENQSNPWMLATYQASSFTLQRVVFRNAPEFHIHFKGPASNVTVWGIKIITPQYVRNSDGIDPDEGVTNLTIANSYISNGDDMVAISPTVAGQAASAISILGNYTFSGRGISIGSGTLGGVSNMLVKTLTQSGNYNDIAGTVGTEGGSGSNGIRIKSASDRGGNVDTITYTNICQRDEVVAAVRFDPFDGGSGTEYPHYTNISMSNVHILPNTNNSTNPNTVLWFQGYDSTHVTHLWLSDFVVDGTPDFVAAPENLALTLGPLDDHPLAAFRGVSGSNVTVTDNMTSNGMTYACSTSSFPTLATDAFAFVGSAGSTGTTQTNQTSVSATSGQTVTLTAVVNPVYAPRDVISTSPPITITEDSEGKTTAPTGTVRFFGNSTCTGTVLTTVALGTNGTSASYSVLAASGTQNYCAQYYDGGNYPTQIVGNYIVTAP